MEAGKIANLKITSCEQDTVREWSQLPSELLRIISSKITDIVDYIQFRSICTSWRSNAKRAHLRTQLPHLLYAQNPDMNSVSLLDLSDYRVSTSEFHEMRNKIICGSSFGYLALTDANDSTLSLFNPLTRFQIQLPSPYGMPYYLGPGVSRYLEGCRSNDAYDEYDLAHKGWQWGVICKGYPWRVHLSSHPSKEDCVVAVTLSCAAEFAFCKIGDENWSFVDTTLPWPLDYVVSHNGIFYVFDEHANCWAYDFVEGKKRLVHSPDVSSAVDSYNAVQSDAGLLMVVCYKQNDSENEEVHPRIGVFKLDAGGEEMKWDEVKSLGDSAIFLSGNCSSVARVMDFPGCRKDCIYFNGPYGSDDQKFESEVYHISVYDLKENKFEKLFCPWILSTKRKGTWITPSLC